MCTRVAPRVFRRPLVLHEFVYNRNGSQSFLAAPPVIPTARAPWRARPGDKAPDDSMQGERMTAMDAGNCRLAGRALPLRPPARGWPLTLASSAERFSDERRNVCLFAGA